jgi:hypothetical protein
MAYSCWKGPTEQPLLLLSVMFADCQPSPVDECGVTQASCQCAQDQHHGHVHQPTATQGWWLYSDDVDVFELVDRVLASEGFV